MTEEQALLAAVKASPDDDLPRLVYADWLEENEQVERAEFIRVQVELDKPCTACKGDGRYDDDMGGTMQCRGCFGAKTRRGWEESESLRGRERVLLKAHAAEWLQPSPTPHPPVVNDAEQTGWGLKETTRLGDRYIPVAFRRGFVADVWCDMLDWCGNECWRCGGRGRYGVERHSGPRRGPSVRYVLEPPGPHTCTTCSGTGHIPGIGIPTATNHHVRVVNIIDRWPDTDGHTGPSPATWHRAEDESPFGLEGPATIPIRVFDYLQGQDVDDLGGGEFSITYPTLTAAREALSAACIAWADEPNLKNVRKFSRRVVRGLWG